MTAMIFKTITVINNKQITYYLYISIFLAGERTISGNTHIIKTDINMIIKNGNAPLYINIHYRDMLANTSNKKHIQTNRRRYTSENHHHGNIYAKQNRVYAILLSDGKHKWHSKNENRSGLKNTAQDKEQNSHHADQHCIGHMHAYKHIDHVTRYTCGNEET